jgi:hypothetical protein
LLKHISDEAKIGSKLADLCQVLPALSKSQVQKLAKELKDQKLVEVRGKTNASLWFPIAKK